MMPSQLNKQTNKQKKERKSNRKIKTDNLIGWA